MWTAGFPEPRTFSRAGRAAAARTRAGDFDVVHDNQTLGYGLLEHRARSGCPLVTTIHHPITFDRRIDLAAAPTWRKRLTLRRWYGFLRMQGRVARRLRTVLTPSESLRARRRRATSASTRPGSQVIPLGVDDVFVPPTEPRVPGRILAMASADAPMKGIATLLEAFAKLRTERDARAAAGHQARARRPHRAAPRPARHRRPRALRARHQRRRAGRR